MYTETEEDTTEIDSYFSEFYTETEDETTETDSSLSDEDTEEDMTEADDIYEYEDDTTSTENFLYELEEIFLYEETRKWRQKVRKTPATPRVDTLY